MDIPTVSPLLWEDCEAKHYDSVLEMIYLATMSMDEGVAEIQTGEGCSYCLAQILVEFLLVQVGLLLVLVLLVQERSWLQVLALVRHLPWVWFLTSLLVILGLFPFELGQRENLWE